MKLSIGVAAFFLGTAFTASAQVPAGGELQVNSFTINNQSRPVVASDRRGGFIVAWDSLHPTFNGPDVFARRYDASGTALGAEFQVNTYTPGLQGMPSIAADAAGNFVVVWVGDDASSLGIFGQLFDASGARRGAEFQVNTFTPGVQQAPTVSFGLGGTFVVAWDSDNQDGDALGVFAQRHAAAGARLGGEFRVNTHTPDHQYDASIAFDDGGRFVVAWTSVGQDGSLPGVFARRFDPFGAPLGGEFQVNTTTSFWQYRPSVAADAAGNFVVAWSFRDYIGGPGPIRFPMRIMARRFDPAGAPYGGEFPVSAFTMRLLARTGLVVTADAAGSFVVAWDGSPYSSLPGSTPVFAQRYEASGTPRGGTFTVNSSTPDNTAKYVSMASDGAGNFVIVWDNPDADREGVFAQRFGGLQPAALVVDTGVIVNNDANGVLEPGENVDVRPSWRNVSGATRTFDASATGLTGPAASGVSYLLLDASCAYGAVADGVTMRCADRYEIEVAYGGVRPATHWDATLTERLTPDVLGQTKPWAIHIGDSFTDVPRASSFYPFVETVLHNGVTAGCATASYCPASVTTREQMAAFVIAGKEGGAYAPPPCAPPNTFADVPEASPFCDVIEELARRGVVSGCGGGNYCPTSAVSREQMAVFVLRTLDPLAPPACTAPLFADVPPSSPFCPWIEELARRGVVSGCGGGNYCPTAPVTREQMAVFVSRTFGLALYGP